MQYAPTVDHLMYSKSALFPLWLYRAVIGEVDDDADNGLDFNNIKAEPLNSVSHWWTGHHRLNWFSILANQS